MLSAAGQGFLLIDSGVTVVCRHWFLPYCVGGLMRLLTHAVNGIVLHVHPVSYASGVDQACEKRQAQK